MSPLPIDRFRRACRWLLPAALLALTPKCALCLFAYVGLGTLLGIGEPELCGGKTSAPGHWALAVGLIGAVAGTLFFGLLLRSRCRRSLCGEQH